MSRIPTLCAVAVLSLGALAGCAKNAPPPQVGPTTNAQLQPPAPPTNTSAEMTMGQNQAGDAPVPVSPNVSVSSAILRACNLQVSRATPEFAFDSTQIVAEDKELLASLAKCMSEGALKGKSVELTGRTDSRGESEYNMGLGENRADSVKRYLHDLGVADARLRSTSRGEMDAVGTDESSYAHDRRVDIDLVN